MCSGDLRGCKESNSCAKWVTAGAGGLQLLAGGDLRGYKDSYSCARWITAVEKGATGAGELRLVQVGHIRLDTATYKAYT